MGSGEAREGGAGAGGGGRGVKEENNITVRQSVNIIHFVLS